MSQKAARKKRKRRRHDPPSAASASAPDTPAPEPSAEPSMSDRYARSRERDEAARAALKPLEPGERPLAVTVAVVFALLCMVANLVALIVRYDSHAPNKSVYTLLGVLVLGVCAGGMWRVRYWAVLGMQTILGLAVVGASIALIGFRNVGAVVLCLLIIGTAGTLFWFLVKAMARIQMPERPGARS